MAWKVLYISNRVAPFCTELHDPLGIVSAIAFSPAYYSGESYYAAGTFTSSPINIALFSDTQGEPLMYLGGGPQAGVTQVGGNDIPRYSRSENNSKSSSSIPWNPTYSTQDSVEVQQERYTAGISVQILTLLSKFSKRPILPIARLARSCGSTLNLPGGCWVLVIRFVILHNSNYSSHIPCHRVVWEYIDLPAQWQWQHWSSNGRRTFRFHTKAQPNSALQGKQRSVLHQIAFDVPLVMLLPDAVGSVAFHPYRPAILSASRLRHFTNFDEDQIHGDSDLEDDRSSNIVKRLVRMQPVVFDSSVGFHCPGDFFGNQMNSSHGSYLRRVAIRRLALSAW